MIDSVSGIPTERLPIQDTEDITPLEHLIGMPVFSKEQFIGLIAVWRLGAGQEFKPTELDFLSSLAGQVAVAIENARLFEEAERLNAMLEQRVRERTAQLEAANQELDAFSYSVSHDLRAPLRAVDGYARVLAEDYAAQLPAEAQRYLENIRAGGQRMNQLIQDLLLLSRVTRQTLKREAVNLSRLARAIAAELTHAAPQRSVEFVIAHGLVTEGDPGLLHIVLENLLNNAWKYTSKHAQARIEFGARPPAAGTGALRGRGAGGVGVVFFVRDNGAGFDMAYAHKLFGAFQRLHSESDFEGTGIGLATVQRIIARHGGRIWVEAEMERGATFYFTL